MKRTFVIAVALIFGLSLLAGFGPFEKAADAPGNGCNGVLAAPPQNSGRLLGQCDGVHDIGQYALQHAIGFFGDAQIGKGLGP